jgi:hypothetical protein
MAKSDGGKQEFNFKTHPTFTDTGKAFFKVLIFYTVSDR